jgi:large subunit ribosomal protein L9
MDIILLQDLDKVGDKFDVVTVKDGYGRNYLIPKGFALIANEANMKKLDERKAREAAKIAEQLSDYRGVAEKLEATVLKIGAKAGTSGKIFGSVTNVQLAAAIKEQVGEDVERRLIELPEEVKMLGSYFANVNFHPEVIAKVNFEVIAE